MQVQNILMQHKIHKNYNSNPSIPLKGTTKLIKWKNKKMQ